jgi:hypothetical protein
VSNKQYVTKLSVASDHGEAAGVDAVLNSRSHFLSTPWVSLSRLLIPVSACAVGALLAAYPLRGARAPSRARSRRRRGGPCRGGAPLSRRACFTLPKLPSPRVRSALYAPSRAAHARHPLSPDPAPPRPCRTSPAHAGPGPTRPEARRWRLHI